jgi:hypothetical protein
VLCAAALCEKMMAASLAFFLTLSERTTNGTSSCFESLCLTEAQALPGVLRSEVLDSRQRLVEADSSADFYFSF